MTTNSTCSLFDVQSIPAPSQPARETVNMLDSRSYDSALPISNTYDFNFPSQYNPPSLGTGVAPFPYFTSYFTPEPEGFRSRPNSPPLLIPTGLHINTVQPPEDPFPRRSSRPHSSPSTFGPGTVPVVEWPTQHSIHHPRSDGEESPSSFHNPATPGATPTPIPTPTQLYRQSYSLSSLSELQNQPSRRYYAPIAPNPTGVRQLQAQAHAQKRAASEEEWESPSRKRKRSIPLSPQFEITDEDTFLLKLKDDESLSWKEIASRFQTDMGKKFQVPALQMRLKRLRERMRVWTDNDVTALKMAHEYWTTQKFEIIAAKMVEYGATEKWNARQCARKLSELSSAGEQYFNPLMMMRTPTFTASHTSSPIEASTPGFVSPFATTLAGSFAKSYTFADTSA